MKKGETFADDSYESSILKVGDLLDEEKTRKAELKTETAKLHLKTKETIEQLSDEQVTELLETKWITPLVNSLHSLPEVVINKLAASVQALSDKYAVTYEEVVNQIHETETTLTSLMDELVGSEYDMKGISEFKSLLKGV